MTDNFTCLSTHSPLDLSDFAADLLSGPDGIWRGRGTEPVSYPVSANDACFELEDSSFWFTHRNACLTVMLDRFPTSGPFFDVGGGNGCDAAAVRAL